MIDIYFSGMMFINEGEFFLVELEEVMKEVLGFWLLEIILKEVFFLLEVVVVSGDSD